MKLSDKTKERLAKKKIEISLGDFKDEVGKFAIARASKAIEYGDMKEASAIVSQSTELLAQFAPLLFGNEKYIVKDGDES